MKTIAILATGDEITQGSVLNTNTYNIAHDLFSHGLEPQWQMSVADDTDAIEDALAFLMSKHSVVITIGGLGPTSDDKTRFALANYLKEPLIEDTSSLEKLTARYREINLPFTELSKQQTLFPQHAKIMENEVGSANGCYYQKGEQWIFMLPGPPGECLPMFQTYVLPQLISQFSTGKTLLQWKVFGVAEGVIAEKVDDIVKPYESICRTSFRWNYPYVDCKVLINTDAPEKLKITDKLNNLLLPYQLDPEHNQSATQRLKDYLIHVKQPVFIEDFACGGLLESRVRSVENSEHLFFSYKRDVNSLFFHIKGLQNYWHRENNNDKECELVLTSQNGIQKISIPFRKAHLEEYAAELMAHHIFLQLKDLKHA